MTLSLLDSCAADLLAQLRKIKLVDTTSRLVSALWLALLVEMGREVGGTESAQMGVHFDSNRVQAMVEQGVTEIPSVYIRREDERCTLKESLGTNIPVIDMSKEAASLSEEIGNACRDWGFFQVRYMGAR